jgi:hypothetical protein
MYRLVDQLDAWGRPGWIAAMVLGFVFFWPVGLVILFYMLGSGRMGSRCYAYAGGYDRQAYWHRKMERMQMKMDRMRRFFGDGGQQERPRHFASVGNRAFDDYREETLSRLEQEADDFRAFLDRLRHAKDKAEFDLFMAERRGNGSGEPKDVTPREQ